MSFVRRVRVRVLASTTKGLCFGSHIPLKLVNSQKTFCSYASTSNPLIQRLIKEPTSRTKAILDSEENSILKSFDFSWHALIAALNSSSTSKAVQALEWRLEKMLKYDERNPEQYSDLICLCGETRSLQLAIRAFLAMESDGVKPTVDVFNSLISVSLSSRNEMTALSLFEIMERSKDYKPNSKTYNAFISMYSKVGNFNAMQEWASAKTAAGFTADLRTYESLISGSIKAKKFDLAGNYYDEMMSSGIIPNITILEKMFDGLCEQRHFADAKGFVLHMLDNGWEISAHITHTLAGLYSELGKIVELEELLQTLTDSNQNPEVLSQVHCGVISMHARADRLDDMEYSVGRMLKHGITFKSAEVVNLVICSYFRRAAYDRLELFLDHVKSSHQFSRSTYDLLVAGCRKAGLSDRLDTLLKDMCFSGIS